MSTATKAGAHTPTLQYDGVGNIYDESGYRYFAPCGGLTDSEACGMADRVTRAVNSHAALVEALKACEGVVEWALENGAHPGARAIHAQATAALAAAEGGV